jgi:DNA-binding response OmpR family regulator
VTALEFRLLSAFIRRRGRVLSRQQLIEAGICRKRINQHVTRIRQVFSGVLPGNWSRRRSGGRFLAGGAL